MLPIPPGLFNRHERHGRNLAIVLACFLLAFAVACRNDVDSPGSEALKASRRAKPEGLLLVVRQLDLGTLPLNGSMELLLSAKNPTDMEIVIEKYEVSREGLKIEPTKIAVGPNESIPVTVDLTPVATSVPGSFEWDIAARTPNQELAFRTTLFLIVRDDVVVRPNAASKTKTAKKKDERSQ
jgi:hypothetical protein